MSTRFSPPKLPYQDFPLRRHRNGHWYKSVWNRRSKRTEHFYFGTWTDDPKGERAITDPIVGWLARRDAIKNGIDNLRVQAIPGDLTLGELMSQFLVHKRGKVNSGELSLATLDGYLKEITAFVAFLKPSTPATSLRPEHFSAYMKKMIEERKLGRFARKRVVTYINTFLRFGVKNGWTTMPNAGVDWAAPATDPDSMRIARARAGILDYSDRLVTGKELDELLKRSQPAFRGMILLAVNCGLGPADLGRLRWNMIDLEQRHLIFPRPKTGVRRVGHLWKKTQEALRHVRKLKHNRVALEQHGEESLVFITRKNLPYYREVEVHGFVDIEGHRTKKLLRIKVDNSILRTFRRMASELGLKGLTFYRLRHSFRTYGQRARDREALDACMGHREPGIGGVYNHETIAWNRIRHVARVVRRRLWPEIKRPAGMPALTVKIANEGGAEMSSA